MHLVLLLEILKSFFIVHFEILLMHFTFNGSHIFGCLVGFYVGFSMPNPFLYK